jgi:hypothetical protein
VLGGDTVRVRPVIPDKQVTPNGKRAVTERTLSPTNRDATVAQEGIAGTILRLEGA